MNNVQPNAFDRLKYPLVEGVYYARNFERVCNVSLCNGVIVLLCFVEWSNSVSFLFFCYPLSVLSCYRFDLIFYCYQHSAEYFSQCLLFSNYF